MGGWETVIAAFGGLVLGLGLGIVLSRRLERSGAGSGRASLTRVESLLRASVIPVLEVRAERLGLSRDERGRDSRDPVELAVTLSQSIQRIEEKNNMAFSDTLEVSRTEFNKELKTQTGKKS